MLKNVSRAKLTAAWFATMLVLFALSVVWGANVSIAAGELWLVACLAPPAVMLFVWRAPPITVAELLYAVNTPNKDGRS